MIWMYAALCSYAPTDVMSPTVIGTDSASGKIRRLPFTKVLPDTPTQETETDYDGCFNDRVVKTSRVFNLESKAFKANHSDDEFWLPKILEGKSIEGRFYFNDDGKTIEKFDIKDL